MYCSCSISCVFRCSRRHCCNRRHQRLAVCGTNFDPSQDWPQPIATNATITITMQKLAFLGTQSSRELIGFMEANPSRHRWRNQVCRYVESSATGRTSSLICWFGCCHVSLHLPQSSCQVGMSIFKERPLEPAAHGDGHITVALLFSSDRRTYV